MRCGLALVLAALLTVSGCKNSDGPASSGHAPPESETAKPVISASSPVAAQAVSAVAPKTSPSAAGASASASTRSATPANVYRWTDKVTLTGTLVEREVLSAKGGSIKTTFLKLEAPISVHDDPSGQKLGSYDDESELWYARDGGPVPPGLLGKRVTFRGTLNPMQTGHHHSNVWLTGEVAPLP